MKTRGTAAPGYCAALSSIQLKTHSPINAVTAMERQTHAKLREPEIAFADAVVAHKKLAPRPSAARKHPSRAGYRSADQPI